MVFLRGSSLKGVVFSCHRSKVNSDGGCKNLIDFVSEAKTPFLSFLDDGGSEKKYERVRFGREILQKKGLKLGTFGLSRHFARNFRAKCTR